MHYDKAGQCPSCNEYFPLNSVSNNKALLKLVREDFAKIKQTLPTDWIQENKGERLFTQRQQKDIGPARKANLKRLEEGKSQSPQNRFEVNWNLFRNALYSSGINFEQKSKPMRRKELLLLFEVNQQWAKLAAGLILCGKRNLRCPHKGCREDLWKRSLEMRRPFHKISYEATRVVLEKTIGSPTARAALELDGFINDNPIKLRMGKLGGEQSRNARKLIAEAILTSTSVLGDIEIGSDDSSIGKVCIRKSDSEEASKVYTTPNHNIVTSLAEVVQRIRPIEAFIRDGRDPEGYHNWSTICAGQILHAIHQSGCLFKVEKTGSWTYSNKSTNKNATNLVRLNDEIQKKIATEFVSIMSNGDTYNSLECMLSGETTPPMVCKPIDRTWNESKERWEGGFLTPLGQRKKGVVSQAPQYDHFGEERFNPSQEAIDAINNLQSTEWKVDRDMAKIAKITINNHIKNSIVSKFKVRKTDDKYYIDFIDTKPSVTFGQVNSWLRTFEFIERLEINDPDMRFWHAWHFDWRGRVMPFSTMLSPQNDDFCRGIITFENSHILTESGRKWIGRAVAAMYRKRPIPEIFTGDKRESLQDLIDKLELRTPEIYDEVSKNELFQEMMRVIAEEPNSEQNFACWGEDDVFKAKAEGLQRIALTREFVSILDQGDNAVSRLPINLDASSSIYQHSSVLMKDPDMASKVNVLPNGTGMPSDVYLEVVDNLEKKWSGNPFSNFTLVKKYEANEVRLKGKDHHTIKGLDNATSEKLKKELLVRGMAKKPVMTIGYGAHKQSMVRSLLTDNNKENGVHGGFFTYDLRKGTWLNLVEDYSELDDRDFHRLVCAHPSSVLGIICNKLKIPNHLHNFIAQKVIDGFTESIEDVLPGYKKMKESLAKICDTQKKKTKDSDKRLKWQVKDSCEITNTYFKKPKMVSIKSWTGMDKATKALRNVVRGNLDEEFKDLIPIDNLSPVNLGKLTGMLDENLYNKLRDHEISRLQAIVDVLTDIEVSSESIDLENLTVDWAQLATDLEIGDCHEDIMRFTSEKKSDKGKMRVVKKIEAFSGKHNVYFSRNVLSNEVDFGAAKRGIAPNFIHSLDSCNMRKAVNRHALKTGVKDFWSVHDAFGCHPNFMEDLKDIVLEEFASVHEDDENGRGQLQRLFYETTGEELEVGDMNVKDVIKESNGEKESRYFIS